MFTGIITDLGKVNALKRDNGLTIELSTSYDTSTIDIGASVACSGVCLTVINKKKGILFFDVSEETLKLKHNSLVARLNTPRGKQSKLNYFNEKIYLININCFFRFLRVLR